MPTLNGRDRLSELRANYTTYLDLMDDEQDVPAESKFVGTFYNHVSSIEKKLSNAESGTEFLQKSYSSLIVMTSGTKEYKETKTEIEEKRNATNKLLFEVRGDLDQMKKDMTKVKILTAEYRIRENQHLDLTNRFRTALEKYNRCNTEFYEKEENNLKRQIKVVDPSLSDDKVEEMIQQKDFDISSFMDKVFLSSSTKSTISAVYQSAKETRDDLLALEDSMEELLQLFRDLNTLVHDQQSVINNIEYNAHRAAVAVEKGLQDIKKSRKMKKKCIIS